MSGSIFGRHVGHRRRRAEVLKQRASRGARPRGVDPRRRPLSPLTTAMTPGLTPSPWGFRHCATWRRRPGYIGKWRRVTRAGGRIVCLEVSRPDNAIVHAGFNLTFSAWSLSSGRMAATPASRCSPCRRLRPYTYLPALEHLPPAGEIVAMMEAAGLKDARRIPLTGGIVSLYVGVKA